MKLLYYSTFWIFISHKKGKKGLPYFEVKRFTSNKKRTKEIQLRMTRIMTQIPNGMIGTLHLDQLKKFKNILTIKIK